MKKILVLVLAIFLSFSAFALEDVDVVEGGIKYNADTAKTEAFKGVQKKIKRTNFKDYLRDKNRKENLKLLSIKITEQNDRYLCPFYLNEVIISYAITYKDNYLYTFYYNILGNLVKIDISQSIDKYPRRIISYSRYGNLIGVIFETSKDEEFIYDKNGKLIARWLDKDMYDKEDNFPKFLKLKRGNLD